jgi:hypothetical protein
MCLLQTCHTLPCTWFQDMRLTTNKQCGKVTTCQECAVCTKGCCRQCPVLVTLAQPVVLQEKHEVHGECDSPSACRSGPGLRHALQLRTGKNTAWQPYKPSESALHHLAYCVHPRQQVQLADLQPEMIGSNVDMTCVLLWAGAIGRGQSSPVGL